MLICLSVPILNSILLFEYLLNVSNPSTLNESVLNTAYMTIFDRAGISMTTLGGVVERQFVGTLLPCVPGILHKIVAPYFL